MIFARAPALLLAYVTLAAAVQTVTLPGDSSPEVSGKILDTVMRRDNIPEVDYSARRWRTAAHHTIRKKLETKINVNKAKNGIFFIGDGMSLATVMAARTYAGQVKKSPGEETRLAFEDFPVSGLAKTYCVDAQVADSACTATAYLTGVKTMFGTIGMTANVTRGRCESQLHEPNWSSSILAWALDEGLDVGIVTTTRVTHASPAGAYAHAAERDWESDADLPEDAIQDGCRDIATQLIRDFPGKEFKVIMGGGLQELTPNLTSSGNPGSGKRLDGVDLTEEWVSDKEEDNKSHAYVTDTEQLMKIYSMSEDEMPEYLLGIFNDDHLDYHLLSQSSQPTLQQMTEVAIKMLRRSPNGYFLFVEGGRIDHAHHENLAHLALDETLEYSKAIHRASSMTSEEDTLIVVSSDHAHTMTVAGYASRGNDILGVVDTAVSEDGIPYTTLSYANGLGYQVDENGARLDVTKNKSFVERNPEYVYPGLVQLDSETHGGEDVAVWARGPWQHLFTSTFEQHVIPHMMAFAMCITEEGHDACTTSHKVEVSGASSCGPSVVMLVLAVIFCLRIRLH